MFLTVLDPLHLQRRCIKKHFDLTLYKLIFSTLLFDDQSFMFMFQMLKRIKENAFELSSIYITYQIFQADQWPGASDNLFCGVENPANQRYIWANQHFTMFDEECVTGFSSIMLCPCGETIQIGGQCATQRHSHLQTCRLIKITMEKCK